MFGKLIIGYYLVFEIWCLVIVALSNAFVLNKTALLRRRKRDGARRKTRRERISGYAGGHIGREIF
jgi:hypothetical protein